MVTDKYEFVKKADMIHKNSIMSVFLWIRLEKILGGGGIIYKMGFMH